jgi:hypothetical protein
VPWRRATSKRAVSISAAHSGRSKGIWPYQATGGIVVTGDAPKLFRLSPELILRQVGVGVDHHLQDRSGKEREEVARHQPYESGSETPNAIKIAMRAKQAPVSRSVLILGMKSMK